MTNDIKTLAAAILRLSERGCHLAGYPDEEDRPFDGIPLTEGIYMELSRLASLPEDSPSEASPSSQSSSSEPAEPSE